MQELRANTSVDVLIGPFVEDGDGDTPLTGITIIVELSKLGQGLATKNEGSNPTHDAGGTVDGYYNCALDDTDTNAEGTLTLVAHHADALPIRHDYMVLAEAAWDSKYAPKDDGFMDVNIKTVGRTDTDETAADNLELQYDGTGLIGDTFPFTQAEGAAIGGGLAINTTMVSVTVIEGSEQNLANASTSDDSRWTGDDDDSGAEFIFRCTPEDTSSIPVQLTFEGYYDEPNGATNGATLQVYNFNTAGWDTIATFTNAVGTVKDEDHEVPLSHAHKAPGSDTLETVVYTIGDVLIKFKQDATETGDACLLIDLMTVGFVGNNTIDVLFAGGKVYVDAAGTDSTTGKYGSAPYPTNSLANGKTIADAKSLDTIIVHGDHTLSEAMENYTFIGHGHMEVAHRINIDSQSVEHSVFKELVIQGTMANATGVLNITRFTECQLWTLSDIHGLAIGGALLGTCSILDGGIAIFNEIGCGALAACTLTLQAPAICIIGMKGVLTLAGMDGGTAYISMAHGSTLTILVSCDGGTITVSGDTAGLTDQSAAGCTVNVVKPVANTVEVSGTTQTANDMSGDINTLISNWTEVDNDGTVISLAGAIKLILSVLTGKSSGGGTATIVFRDINDSKDRISATVDANGNRTAIGTRDAS